MRGGRAILVGVLAGVAPLATPAEAHAATVAGQSGVVLFEADPGERNVVSVQTTDDGRILIRDTGAALTPGDGCSADGEAVSCTGYMIIVNAGDDDDSLSETTGGFAIQATLHGDDGDDMLSGDAPNLYGDAGDDGITAARVGQEAMGGDGNDRIDATGAYSVSGGPGNDHITLHACPDCGTGSASANGGDGADDLFGSEGPDSLEGGAGDDVLRGAGGADFLSGGDGDDTVELGNAGNASLDGYYVPGAYGTLDARADGGPGNDHVSGGSGRDRVDGGNGNDTIDAGEGDDELVGGAGDDELHGRDGNDRLKGGNGTDLVDGGPGPLDSVDLSDLLEPVSIDMRTPGGDGRHGENDTYLPGVDDFLLTEWNDRFVAGASPVRIDAGSGHDTLIGGPGDDAFSSSFTRSTLTDDAGGDTMDGRGGNDTNGTGPGNDTLRGGPGNDTLSGGSSLARYGTERRRYPNRDRIYGGPGGDYIRGGWRVSAGPGDDRIQMADFEATNRSPVIPLGRDGDARCGPGDDFAGGDYYDGIGTDCETVWNGALPWQSIRPDRTGRVTLVVRCAWDYGASCRGVARLRPTSAKTEQPPPYPITAGRVFDPPKSCRAGDDRLQVGARHFRIRAGRVDRIVLRLSERGRRRLSRAGCLRVRADLRSSDPTGYAHAATRTLALWAAR